jgi:hypothetical protein
VLAETRGNPAQRSVRPLVLGRPAAEQKLFPIYFIFWKNII